MGHRQRIAVAMLALALAGCESRQQMVGNTEDHLLAAGFQDEPANTAQRHALLMRLPQHKFLRRVHGQTVKYVYSDPTVCGCLYVGSEQAFGRYQQYRQQQALADEQQETAMDYSDPNWDWGPWGPGFGPGFGYGPGIGW
ncbi:hypothetical protein [Tanticharoenia sakaeratensis]|uniref:Lipoprotein n=1 Tax=Tanticharoenia sakaeratensis NBRC 103193 TaxID=1231623 RepID=A0A0D6MNX4_9PROT|nr:hypothetical protein [Tanticharoenia sakaeratensis]GAN54988.1 hypothetical protein Tasa_036_006 [Tanticharoenia sakaeratensis NBRC 103193]GBQ20451.1 hypothetical protein AA103193_1384 [Tanticharoenia sakaeratensis NBRC 103193]